MLSLALLFVRRVFSSFNIVITSLGEERPGRCASRAFVCLFLHKLIAVPFRFFLVSRGWRGL